MIIGCFNLSRAYTGVTFIATSVFLLAHLFIFKSSYLGRFYFAYLILLVPFLIVNGILTGSLIEAQVVWYNEDENLGLRVLTIPIEDFVYGLLLILTNVTIYESLIRLKTKK